MALNLIAVSGQRPNDQVINLVVVGLVVVLVPIVVGVFNWSMYYQLPPRATPDEFLFVYFIISLLFLFIFELRLHVFIT